MGMGIVGKGRTVFQTNNEIIPAILFLCHREEERKITVTLVLVRRPWE